MVHNLRGLVLFVGLFLASCAVAQEPEYDFVLEGRVADTLEIPNSGGAWSVTIEAPHPELQFGTQYLFFICDHEQEVTEDCAELEIDDEVAVAGWVLSNEPHSGQRLSIRFLAVNSSRMFEDGFESGGGERWGGGL